MDERKPIVDYAPARPSRRSILENVVRGVGIFLTCVAQFMLTLGICRMGMIFDQKLDGLSVAGEDLLDPFVLVIFGVAIVLTAFRLIRLSTPRAQ